MRKHRNIQQEKIFLEFMEKHQDIARGYVKGDRVAKDLLWESLTEKLNSSGPPRKDCHGWKKTWTDWKAYVKNKMSHNKKENLKTGGGQFNKYILSDVEESVAALSGIYRSVEGIVGARDFADTDLTVLLDSEEENESVLKPIRAGKVHQTIKEEAPYANVTMLSCAPSTSKSTPKNFEGETIFERSPHCDLIVTNKENNPFEEQKSTGKKYTMSKRKRLSLTPSPNLNRKKTRTCTPKNVQQHDLNNLLFEENNSLQSIVKLMEEQREELKSQNRKLGRLCDIFKNYFEDKKKHDREMQKLCKEKNGIKLKLLEIEALKIEFEKTKSKLV